MDKKRISATIIADSVNGKTGDRLTTFLLVFPRIVLAEFNTHRKFSRNSASSRAIPFKTMLKNVQEDPFIPIKWMKDHSGMQGTHYFSDEEVEEYDLLGKHLFARDCAVACAKSQAYLTKIDGKWLGLTKQVVNRYLEPFLYHTVIVTASEWENFFALRADNAAEIHIQDLAYKMLEEYNKSTPKTLQPYEWHIPFGDKIDEDKLWREIEIDALKDTKEQFDEAKLKIATARCARVSYLNFDGNDDYGADVKLYDRLSSMGHWSPFEHCAKALPTGEESGNFKGWLQLRKTFFEENKKDNRVEKKW
jgi:thymidylate synthase ThyX